MARLLYETLSRGIATDYTQRLLAAFPRLGFCHPGRFEFAHKFGVNNRNQAVFRARALGGY